ncbi:MAG: ComF family protein [Pseudomonadota bacterium]
MRALLSPLLDVVYPPTCLTCEEPAMETGGLCASCWRETPLIAGRVCDRCGAPMEYDALGGSDAPCESCQMDPPAWDRGRAAVLYQGGGRDLALGLKHGDRLEAAAPMARWMARSGQDLLAEADGIVPVPLHWRRRLRRRFNQAAELGRALSAETDIPFLADGLRRTRFTGSQDGRLRDDRFANVQGAFLGRRSALAPTIGGTVVLVDDVMTTGATLSACADALRRVGVAQVHVLVFARVLKDATEA